jgi:hypothetical protein
MTGKITKYLTECSCLIHGFTAESSCTENGTHLQKNTAVLSELLQKFWMGSISVSSDGEWNEYLRNNLLAMFMVM